MVEKEVKWTKKCKDPELVGKVKEVINQVSHSKKCPRFKGENGAWANSYSLLQDRFYQHMKDAGFQNFERAERGSTAEHLTESELKEQISGLLKKTFRLEKSWKAMRVAA